MTDLAISDESPIPRKLRPKLVWVITIFYFFAASYTLLSFGLIYGGFISLNEAQQNYFSSQNLFDICLSIGAGVLNIVGAIFLFLLRKFAYHAFLSAFVISLILTVYQVMFENLTDAIGGPGFVGAIIGWAISISIILYVKSLTKKKILE